MRQTLVHLIARVALVGVFAYQGAVPKLLTRNVDEIAMLRDAGVAFGVTGVAVTALGILGAGIRSGAPARLAPAVAGVRVSRVYAPGHRGGRAELTTILRGGVQPCLAERLGGLPRSDRPSRPRESSICGTLPAASLPGELMSSIYERVLGADFHRLHPQIQRRFGFSSCDGIASIGTGTMDEIWKGRIYTEPFLRVGSWRRIMFPETGRHIPFTVENYAFVDQFGRETVSWIRTFESRRTRRFDAYMVYSDARRRIVDYLGSHEHLAVDIDLSVDEDGGLRLRSGNQRFYEGVLGFSFPMLFSGIADVREWYDDAARCFRIVVDVRNRVWGPLFGYRGSFNVEWRKVTGVPNHILPTREECRD
jgi:hypothetical protein